MTGKTHIATGILAAIAAAAIPSITLEPVHLTILTFGSIYGSLLPDIDADYSIAKNRLPISTGIYSLLAKHFASQNEKNYFVHRGIMHSVCIPLLCYLACRFVSMYVVKIFLWGMIIGLFMHLFLDLLSSGEKLFAPLCCKRISFPVKFKTGGIMDHLLRYTGYIASFFIFFMYVYAKSV